MKKTLAALSAAAIAAAALSGCGSQAASGKGLDASLDYSVSKVMNYSSSQARAVSDFADSAFCKANSVAMVINSKTDKEQFEEIARNFMVESITVTDGTGKITACYPEGEEGKTLKETDDKKSFNRIIKGITVKSVTDPVPSEDGEGYYYMAGVGRVDTDEGGIVVIGAKTYDYDKVTGENVAEKCGVNTIVLSEGAVLSSTMDKVERGAKAEDIGIKTDDIEKGEFALTVDGVTYNCKSKAADDFTVICAEEV